MRIAVLALFLGSLANAADPVLLASRRGGAIEAYQPDTLDTIARIQTGAMTESVASNADGSRLYIRQPRAEEPHGCCGLFALDTASMKMSLLVWPSGVPTITPSKVYTQRGNVGIEVIDALNLARLPTLKAPSTYQLEPSPDGRWVFGAGFGPYTRSLDIFDTASGALVNHLPVEGAITLHGAFLGNQYYLLSNDSSVTARVWAVNPGQSALGQPKLVSFAGAGAGCNDIFYSMSAAGSRLVIFDVFGGKGDREGCPGAGGFFSLDPVTGASSNRLAAAAHCREIVSNNAGSSLYCLNVEDPGWRQVSLVKLDSSTGAVLAQKELPPDVWNLTTGAIPHSLAGRLDLAVQ
jgi:hypothetical protein